MFVRRCLLFSNLIDNHAEGTDVRLQYQRGPLPGFSLGSPMQIGEHAIRNSYECTQTHQHYSQLADPPGQS